MKRKAKIASLLLTAVLLCSLCACGETDKTKATTGALSTTVHTVTTAPKRVPTLADCTAVDGMVSHTSAKNYSYAEANGVVSTRNLLFVPAGTVIGSEKRMAVYTYDTDLLLDTALVKACGQSTVGEYIVMMAEGSLTIPADCYIRVSVQESLESVTLTYPAAREKEVRVYNVEYETYQRDYDRILPLVSASKDTVNYVFITDVHHDQNNISAAQRASLKKQVQQAVKMANESDAIDFVVVGGDNTSGHYPNKQTSLNYTNAVFAPLKECKKPVLMLMGNHDDNSYSCNEKKYVQADADNLISKVQWNNAILKVYAPENIVHDSKNENSAYYYYDLPGKKTRLVCLDAIDYAQETDENGTILASSLELNDTGNSRVGRSSWGYSARQLQWLATEALTAGEGWDYIFLSHMNAQSSYRYGDELLQMMTAFRERTSYTDDEIGTVDFTAATGEILVYQHGHGHAEMTTLLDGPDVWRVETATANIAQLTNNKKGSANYRAFETDTECCFDVMAVGKDVVKKYAFGAGKDAELTE